MKQIYFAGGCFWGTEHYMGTFEGVAETVVGYANGELADPTYQQVYTDRTGIYWTDEADRAVVELVYEEVQQAYGEVLAVEKGPLKSFYPAEEYHQNYLLKNPEGYCHLSLLILIEKYKKAPEEAVQFYLSHLKGINNWDLVDLSAPYILGDFLVGHPDHSVLYDLAHSPVMWEQRIAVASTLMLIRHGQFNDTIELAGMFLDTRHDLMQKAVGWMLREIGKRDKPLLVSFLNAHKAALPRTTLRYAIERFSAEERKRFMAK